MMLFQYYYYSAARTTTTNASRNVAASFLGVASRKGKRAVSTTTTRCSVIRIGCSAVSVGVCRNSNSSTRSSNNNWYHTSLPCWNDGTSPLSSVGTNLSSREGSNSRKIYFDGYTASGVDVLGMLPETNESSAIMVRVKGSFVAFHTSIYVWNSVHSSTDIRNMDPFQLLMVRQPKIDVLLIGIHPQQPRLDPQVFQTIRSEFSKRGTTVECLDWLQACSTFNLLNFEDRNVAIALIANSSASTEQEEGGE